MTPKARKDEILTLLRAALEDIVRVLGPAAPTCEGCAVENVEALTIARAALAASGKVPLVTPPRLREAIERGVDAPWQPDDPRDARTQLVDGIEREVLASVLTSTGEAEGVVVVAPRRPRRRGGASVTVYVDGMRARYGRMVMCHMLADTTEELLTMADRIGVARRWLQDSGEPTEHFDIALAKRRLAIEAGAVEISLRQAGELIRARLDREAGR